MHEFQSTHPVWDATACSSARSPSKAFQSTHPVWDATFSYMCPASRHEYFNPRIPYGMRPVAPCALSRCLSNFNPRIPYGMRHLWQYATGLSEDFNPRIPYGMRPNAFEQLWTLYPFQSTHPVWDATVRQRQLGQRRHISIHASRMGCDPVKKGCGLLLGISIHASRMGCDLRLRRLAYSGQDFNPRIPYGMRLSPILR